MLHKINVLFNQTPVDSVLNLTLTDCNDFGPVFSMLSYTFNIDEAIVGPTTSMDVFSGIAITDGDATSVNRIATFSIIDAPSSTNGWFGIDPDTVSYRRATSWPIYLLWFEKCISIGHFYCT